MSIFFSFARMIREYKRTSPKIWLVHGDEKRLVPAVWMPENRRYGDAFGGLRSEVSRDLVSRVNLRVVFEEKLALQALRVLSEGELYEVLEERNYGGLSDAFLYRLQVIEPPPKTKKEIDDGK